MITQIRKVYTNNNNNILFSVEMRRLVPLRAREDSIGLGSGEKGEDGERKMTSNVTFFFFFVSFTLLTDIAKQPEGKRIASVGMHMQTDFLFLLLLFLSLNKILSLSQL